MHEVSAHFAWQWHTPIMLIAFIWAHIKDERFFHRIIPVYGYCL